MHVIKGRNVHEIMPEAFRELAINGVQRDSRNGPVLVHPQPVTTVYEKPLERVEFWAQRDSNPIFHLMEALWMLGGREDVDFPTYFNSKFSQFSDDGTTFNGAYGYRWRNRFGIDQLKLIADRLKKNPNDRRCVLQIWNAGDLIPWEDGESKDVPCNTQAYFQVGVDGRLDMTVCCRSNDIVWGCYGSNAVHFSFLLEYVAARVGVPPGIYRQMSNNWHAYESVFNKVSDIIGHAEDPMYGSRPGGPVNPYRDQSIFHFPLIQEGEDPNIFDHDLQFFLDAKNSVFGVRSRFLRRVAGPLAKSYHIFKDKANPNRFADAMAMATECEAEDWMIAAVSWYNRRRHAAATKNQETND
jgi:thymidylate synthase